MRQHAEQPRSESSTSPPRVGALRRLAGFLFPYRRRIAGALAALVIAAGSVLALGQGLKLVIDAGFSSGDPGLLDRALAGVVAVAVVMSAATWARFYLMMTTGERVITDIRRAVYGHLLALEPAFFEQIRTGEVISRLTNDVTQLQAVIGFGISMFLRNALMGFGALVMLVLTSGKLAALVVPRRAGDAGADPAPRPQGAPALAREPGPGRRRLGLRRRVDPRDPHRPGLRPRGRRPEVLRRARGGRLRGRRRADRQQGVPDLGGDADRLLRRRADSLDRRPRRARRPDHGGRTVGVRLLRDGRRERGRGALARPGASCSAPPDRPSA